MEVVSRVSITFMVSPAIEYVKLMSSWVVLLGRSVPAARLSKSSVELGPGRAARNEVESV